MVMDSMMGIMHDFTIPSTIFMTIQMCGMDMFQTEIEVRLHQTEPDFPGVIL